MVRRNYNIEEYIGSTRQALKQYSSLLDTGTKSRFIKVALIPTELWNLIAPLKDHTSLWDESKRIVIISNKIT